MCCAPYSKEAVHFHLEHYFCMTHHFIFHFPCTALTINDFLKRRTVQPTPEISIHMTVGQSTADLPSLSNRPPAFIISGRIKLEVASWTNQGWFALKLLPDLDLRQGSAVISSQGLSELWWDVKGMVHYLLRVPWSWCLLMFNTVKPELVV